MGHLHELLAVETEKKATYEKMMSEAFNTFSKKTEHFQGHVKTLKMFSAERENEETSGLETKELVSTVDEKLDYALSFAVAYLDVVVQKEVTNQKAKADLIVDGVVFGKDLPVTFLLGLEDKLKKIRQMYEVIPTLQPGIKWEPTTTERAGVYKASVVEERLKTEQQVRHKVVYDATDKHPAQIEKWTDQVPVGKYATEKWSGMITPAEKSKRMARIDIMIEACKKARMRANNEEIVPVSIGKKLIDYINKGA
jgi:hypothetical protein